MQSTLKRSAGRILGDSQNQAWKKTNSAPRHRDDRRLRPMLQAPSSVTSRVTSLPVSLPLVVLVSSNTTAYNSDWADFPMSCSPYVSLFCSPLLLSCFIWILFGHRKVDSVRWNEPIDNEYMKNGKERGPNRSRITEKVAIRVPNTIHSRNVVPSAHYSILPSLADLITIIHPRSILLSISTSDQPAKSSRLDMEERAQ